jgi:hypothetical protein
MFFLKIATYQSTPKILYKLKETKEGMDGTNERTKTFPKPTETPLPCQFFPTASSSKLTPAG